MLDICRRCRYNYRAWQGSSILKPLNLKEYNMEERDHLDIVDFIESTLELREAVNEADESIEDDILPLEF
jgi:hypothetical protein